MRKRSRSRRTVLSFAAGGQDFLVPSSRWMRGPAVLDRSAITLDRSRAVEYTPTPQEIRALPRDLAWIKEPSDVVPFVQKYGLLTQGPRDTQFQESWALWRKTATILRETYLLYVALTDALQDKRGAIDALRRQLLTHVTARIESSSADPGEWEQYKARIDNAIGLTDQALLIHASWFIAETLNALLSGGMKDGFTGIFVMPDADETGGTPGVFSWAPLAPNLIGMAGWAAASEMIVRTPLRECVWCGRVFPVEDQRQIYCSPTCSGRARYQRYASSHGLQPRGRRLSAGQPRRKRRRAHR